MKTLNTTFQLRPYQIELIKGLDIPALEAVQIAKPTQSFSRWLQMVGRALRPSPGKEYATIVDQTRNWEIHGLPSRNRI